MASNKNLFKKKKTQLKLLYKTNNDNSENALILSLSIHFVHKLSGFLSTGLFFLYACLRMQYLALMKWAAQWATG